MTERPCSVQLCSSLRDESHAGLSLYNILGYNSMPETAPAIAKHLLSFTVFLPRGADVGGKMPWQEPQLRASL